MNRHKGRLKTLSPRVRGTVLFRALRALGCGEQGASMVETALMLPILCGILMGILAFGVAFGNYLTLSNATAMASQALSISRGQSLDPCATTYNAFKLGAPSLALSGLTFTIDVDSAPVSGQSESVVYTLWNGGTGQTPSCSSTSLTTGSAADMVQGDVASVTVTYPCNLVIYGHNFAPSCTLTAQTSEVIQ